MIKNIFLSSAKKSLGALIMIISLILQPGIPATAAETADEAAYLNNVALLEKLGIISDKDGMQYTEEYVIRENFAQMLSLEKGIPAIAPYNGAVYDLMDNEFIFKGNTVKKESTKRNEEERFNVNTVYGQLKQTAMEFTKLIPTLEGRANRELRALTQEIRKLMEKYK